MWFSPEGWHASGGRRRIDVWNVAKIFRSSSVADERIGSFECLFRNVRQPADEKERSSCGHVAVQQHQNRMFQQMKIATKYKMYGAHALYRFVRMLGVSRYQKKKIGGVNYSLDLAEGIDLSLYLFGQFQKHIVPEVLCTDERMTVIDVGANSGVMSLQFAKRLPNATVHSFEPSEYANTKFDANIALNPELERRITRVKAFVSDKAAVEKPYVSYSSWRVDRLSEGDAKRHPIHFGESHKSVDRYMTLDGYCAEKGIDDVKLIKIDTDGYEHEVLTGARTLIDEQRPSVIFELALYVLKERGMTFDELVDPFVSTGYVLTDLQSGRQVTKESVERLVPVQGSIDVIAEPEK